MKHFALVYDASNGRVWRKVTWARAAPPVEPGRVLLPTSRDDWQRADPNFDRVRIEDGKPVLEAAETDPDTGEVTKRRVVLDRSATKLPHR